MMSPEEAARRVLERLRIRAPEELRHLEDIAWAACRALVNDGPLAGAEARSLTAGRKSVITVSTTVRSPERRRFAIGHELGHIELHRAETSLAICTTEDIREGNGSAPKVRSEKGRERQANRFAAELLMPTTMFEPMCRTAPPSNDLIVVLARAFATSLTATALRFIDFCGEACAVVYSSEGVIRWFRANREFKDLSVFIPVGQPLDRNTYAASVFGGDPAPTGMHQVDVTAWFAPGRYRADAMLREASWAIPSANAALTLLWVDQDIGPEEEDSERAPWEEP